MQIIWAYIPFLNRDCGDQLLCCQFNNEGTRVAAGIRTGTIKVSLMGYYGPDKILTAAGFGP